MLGRIMVMLSASSLGPRGTIMACELLQRTLAAGQSAELERGRRIAESSDGLGRVGAASQVVGVERAESSSRSTVCGVTRPRRGRLQLKWTRPAAE